MYHIIYTYHIYIYIIYIHIYTYIYVYIYIYISWPTKYTAVHVPLEGQN